MKRTLSKRSTEGFTLLELLVVIIIIGVLFAIAAPGWSAFINRQRLSTANDQVLQALRTGQSEAKRTHTDREVRFDTTSDPPRFAVVPLTNPVATDVQIQTWQTLGQKEIQAGILSLSENNPNSSSIVFNADGAIASNSLVSINPSAFPVSVTVALKNSPSIKRCIKIQTLLGATSQGSNTDCP